MSFGIALHHAGLHERDRKIAEELFVNQKVQVNSPFRYLFTYLFYVWPINVNMDMYRSANLSGALGCSRQVQETG